MLHADTEGSWLSLLWKEKPPSRAGGRQGFNIAFYSGQLPCPAGTIRDIHDWWGWYDRLGSQHAYVHWLFPNYFPSRFNPNVLTKDEAREFRQNAELAAKVVKSYELFLDFLGLSLADKQTGAIARAANDCRGARTRHAFVLFPEHNQGRLQHIFASLCVLGFSRYVPELVSHLHWEATGETPTWFSLQGRSLLSPGHSTPAVLEMDRRVLAVLRGYLPDAQDFVSNTKASSEDLEESVLLAKARSS